jgi:hypothetical protein
MLRILSLNILLLAVVAFVPNFLRMPRMMNQISAGKPDLFSGIFYFFICISNFDNNFFLNLGR